MAWASFKHYQYCQGQPLPPTQESWQYGATLDNRSNHSSYIDVRLGSSGRFRACKFWITVGFRARDISWSHMFRRILSSWSQRSTSFSPNSHRTSKAEWMIRTEKYIWLRYGLAWTPIILVTYKKRWIVRKFDVPSFSAYLFFFEPSHSSCWQKGSNIQRLQWDHGAFHAGSSLEHYHLSL